MKIEDFMNLIVASMNDVTDYKTTLESERLKYIKIVSSTGIEFDLRIQPMILGNLSHSCNYSQLGQAGDLEHTIFFFKFLLKAVKSEDFKKEEKDFFIQNPETHIADIFRANLQKLEFSLFYDESEDMNIEIDKILFQLSNNLKALSYDYTTIFNKMKLFSKKTTSESFNYHSRSSIEGLFPVCTLQETESDNETSTFQENRIPVENIPLSRTEQYVQSLAKQGGEDLIIEGEGLIEGEIIEGLFDEN